MSDEPERLAPAEERVRTLMSELAGEDSPRGKALTRSVVATARWQRPVRRFALALAASAGALAMGVGAAIRAVGRR